MDSFSHNDTPFDEINYKFEQNGTSDLEAVYNKEGEQVGNIFRQDGKISTVDVFLKSKTGQTQTTVTSRYDQQGIITEIDLFNHSSNKHSVFPGKRTDQNQTTMFENAVVRKGIEENGYRTDKIEDKEKQSLSLASYQDGKLRSIRNFQKSNSDGSDKGSFLNIEYNKEGAITSVTAVGEKSQYRISPLIQESFINAQLQSNTYGINR